MTGLLNRCLLTGNHLEMIYISKHGEFSQRIIRVLEVTNSYVIGYCILRKQRRKFLINNILAAQPKSPAV